ncbi:hypothetical protein AAFF_G00394330 [Aldrovandia affinis]|uniref:Uncharacterized protein n=1 Tax=Aldrovandia affinis TaxID=143900 RepID=A0AAD7WLQ0_9TELE|nr:hypothetical protein AAFF_G00394330 [Aldrovandia affinis]
MRPVSILLLGDQRGAAALLGGSPVARRAHCRRDVREAGGAQRHAGPLPADRQPRYGDASGGPAPPRPPPLGSEPGPPVTCR